MSGTEEEVPSEIKGGGAEKKYEEAVEKTDSVEEAESSKLEKGPSEIEGQQHVLSHLKELKIECEGGEAEKLKIECEVGEAEEKHEEAEEQRDSVEEAESSQLEEEEDDDEDEDEDDDDEKQDSQTMSYPDNDDDYLAEGETEVDWERWDKYDEQVKATEGFGLTVDVGLCAMAALRPVPNFKKRYNFFCELSDVAIKKFNQDNIGKEFKVVDVDWVVNQGGRGVIYLLTFKAEDADEGVKVFEASVLDGIMDEEPRVILCRMKKQQN